MKAQYNPKFLESDFPPQAGFSKRFVSNFVQMAGQLYQSVNGGLSLSDNMNGAKLTLPLVHGVPYLLASPLHSKQIPIGIQPLACDTQPTPQVSMTTSTTVNGTLTAAPAGYVWLTALYPVAITDWVSYTPTGSWSGANVTYTGKWRRVGDSMDVRIKMLVGSAPSGNLTAIAIPSPNTIDSAKLPPNVTTDEQELGVGVMLCAAAGNYRLSVTYQDATDVHVSYQSAPSTDSNISPTVPGTFVAGNYLQFNFSVPIVGWGITGTTANVTLFAWGG